MKKFLKVVGCAGLLVGAIFITNRIHLGLCRVPVDAHLTSDVTDKANDFSKKAENAVHYLYEAHSGPFTDDEKVKKLQELRDAFAALLDSREGDSVPENINYVEDFDNNEQVFTIGDKAGELIPFSDEYKVVIVSAYEESLKDESFKLRLFGSTYGLGTKGHADEDGSKVFAKDDIAKLMNKLKK